MMSGAIPDVILLEDLIDLGAFLEATGRTIPRNKWIPECIEHSQQLRFEAERRASIGALENFF